MDRQAAFPDTSSTTDATMGRLSVRACALAAMATLLVFGQASARAQASVAEPWARSTVTGQKAGGSFMTLRGGAQADRLLGGSTPLAERVELHTMSMDGNVMRMRQVEGIDVPAGQVVALAPGGLHVMFMGLKEELKPGAKVPLTLNFEKAGTVQVQVEVRERAGASSGGSSSMPAGGHKH